MQVIPEQEKENIHPRSRKKIEPHCIAEVDSTF
jgi:hypothetical protein